MNTHLVVPAWCQRNDAGRPVAPPKRRGAGNRAIILPASLPARPPRCALEKVGSPLPSASNHSVTELTLAAGLGRTWGSRALVPGFFPASKAPGALSISSPAMTGQPDPAGPDNATAPWKHGLDLLACCWQQSLFTLAPAWGKDVPKNAIIQNAVVGIGDLFLSNLLKGISLQILRRRRGQSRFLRSIVHWRCRNFGAWRFRANQWLVPAFCRGHV